MMRRLYSALVVLIALSQQSAAQALPSTTDFMNIFMACSMGSSITIEGNLEGSIESIYNEGRLQGRASQQIMSDIIRLIPEGERAEIYRMYLSCVERRLDANDQSYNIQFLPNGRFIDNEAVGAVNGARSYLAFLVDGEEQDELNLTDNFRPFTVSLKRGSHTFTYAADIRTFDGYIIRDSCSISFDVISNAAYSLGIKLDRFDQSHGHISDCYLIIL